jgi:hypothetical protein
MSRPKTEHYIPQFILRQFLVDQSKQQISVYDKHADKGFVTSIKNVMAENRFHDFVFDKNWIVSFEPIASKIEDWCLPTYRRVLETRCLDRSPQEKADLAFLVAFQMLRTKAARVSFEEIGAKMTEKIEAMGHRIEDIPGWEPQTEDTLKRATLMAICDALPSYAELIALKEFRLAEAAPGRSFYLGDNPVCMHNARTFGPYGNLGLAVAGIEIYLPLSSNLMLCAFCPSIVTEIRKNYDDKKHEITSLMLGHVVAGEISAATMKTEMESWRESLKLATEFIEAAISGMPMSSDMENMDFYNSLQTANSYRYVVCQQSDFDLARRHNREFPHLRKGRKITFD